MLSDLRYRLRALFRRNHVETELDDELGFHFEQQVEKYVRAGFERTEAVRRARLEFGGIEQVKVECREARGVFLIETLVQDLGYALRMWRRNPGFALAAITAIALGIGANTAVFTIVLGALAFDPGIKNPDRVVFISTSDAVEPGALSRLDPHLRSFRSQVKSLSGLAAYEFAFVNVSDKTGVPERYACAEISANGFAVAGRKAEIGRKFVSGDERADATPVVMLTHRVWQDRYGRDPSIIGKTIRVNEVPRVVVGVMPAGMRFPEDTDLWIPLADTGVDRREPAMFGRLAAGVDLPAARTEINLIARRALDRNRGTQRGPAMDVVPILQVYGVYAMRPLMIVVLCAVGLVLLIACANVANLILGRAAVRLREISIRIAIGAGRRRIIRQLLVESIVLSFAGGIIGWALAGAGLKWFDAAISKFPRPAWLDLSMNTSVLAYLAAVSIGTGILFGLAPALELSKVDVNSAIKNGGHGSTGGRRGRLSSILVISEVGLCVVLLAGAGLLIRSAVKLYGTPIGVNAANVLTMQIDLPEAKYSRADDEISFHERLKTRMESLPGVEASAVASNLPGAGWMHFNYELEGETRGDSGRPPNLAGLVVSRDYFRVMQVEPRRGRLFDARDEILGGAAAIVNESFAAKFWPGEDALGKHVRLVKDGVRQPWLTVVGVVPDIHQNWRNLLERDPLIYVPYAAETQRTTFLIARTRVPTATLVNAFRREVQKLDENLPVYDIRSLEDRIAQRRLDVGVFVGLFTVFAGIALVLASVGLYAVMAHSVSQRTQEIGLRMALGGGAPEIIRLVLMQGIRQIIIGLAIGLPAALAVTRVLRAVLVGVSPGDPMTFLAVVMVLALTGGVACAIPARRAVRVDPVAALRCE
ncbi:MAG TPA: ABC transporter permease [Bryobacteraceae bacterium]|nr:ABC transporter permease [Bryobacteraceae bacterium]